MLFVCSKTHSCIQWISRLNRMSSWNNKTSLLEISRRLSHQNLSELKSLASLSKFDAEKIKDGMGLFEKLKERDGLGPGNNEYLRNLLQTIGRKDLASRLPDNGRVSYWYPWYTPTITGPTSVSISECHVPTMAEREILQRVLQDLGEDEVDRLVYIYSEADRIPKQAAEGIKSPCQFLRAITDYELLNYDHLCSHLKSIDRTDIACRLCQQLLCLPPPDVPTSCKGPRQLVFMKRLFYVTNVEELQPAEGNKVMWKIHFEEACKFLKQIFQYAGLASLFSVACTREEISSSLEEAFECLPLFVKAHGIVVFGEVQTLDPVKLQEPVHGYIQHFHAFKCLVQSIVETWRQNPLLARAIDMLVDSWKTGERRDKEAQHARKACEAIKEVGELLYGQGHMASEHKKAQQHINTIENYCYASRYWLQIVPWLCILLCVDLSNRTEVLQRIVTKQWGDIVQGYSSISEAVGAPLLEELAEKMPGLELPTCGTYKSSLTSVERLVSPAYVFSVLLAGKALKCPSVNIPKVGTWLVKWLDKEQGHQFPIGIEANVKTTFGMQRVVEELRKYLLNSCDEHGDVHLKRYIDTALPGPVIITC